MINFFKLVIADTLVTKIKVPHKGGQKKRQLYKKNVGYHFGHNVFTPIVAIKRRYHSQQHAPVTNVLKTETAQAVK